MVETPRRWQVGDVRITRVVEHTVEGIPLETFFPEGDADRVSSHPWLVPEFATSAGLIGVVVQAFIVETGSSMVLVDPCVGNGKHRVFPLWDEATFPFLERLSEAGVDIQRIDCVLHTHLHPDHVGWDTRAIEGSWQPTFPQARHLYTQAELDYWRDPAQREAQDVWEDSIEPIFAAGLADIVPQDAHLGMGLSFRPTPGHTPGHVSLWIESRSEVAVISGDVLTHPMQCAYPEWRHIADWDAGAARESREAFLREVLKRQALMLVNHFPGRCSGHVIEGETAYVFEPVDGADVERQR